MKLLASLLGGAAADWACCPYDDFGIVDPDCPLSEKTPWAMHDNYYNNRDNAFTDNQCKAWEANIDATMEGNEDNDSWGGCGFQRHFPWRMVKSTTPNDHNDIYRDMRSTGDLWGDGYVLDDYSADLEAPVHCALGVFDCSIPARSFSVYGALNAGFKFNLNKGAFAADGSNAVFGEVHLGGVCKLWIPVRESAIDSVHVAGVHMNGGGDGYLTGGRPAVFDGAQLCKEEDCATAKLTVKGTAYTFSVVDVGEFMENHSEGGPFNVFASDDGGHDYFELGGPVRRRFLRQTLFFTTELRIWYFCQDIYIHVVAKLTAQSNEYRGS